MNTITLVGCGNMGSALLRGWLGARLDLKYLVLKPHPLPAEFTKAGVDYISAPGAKINTSNIIVLAVKPQVMAGVLPGLKPFVDPKALVISTAAGWKVSQFEDVFGKTQPVVRTIPNLPAAIGKGMTMAVKNQNVTPAQEKLGNQLFNCVGVLEWLDDEAMMNSASSLSGAGPAFIFYLAEVLAKAGENNGVPADLARRAARQTVIGAAALLEARAGDEPSSLREGVTSPNGITAAALKILMNGEMQKLFDQAIAASTKRGGELSG